MVRILVMDDDEQILRLFRTAFEFAQNDFNHMKGDDIDTVTAKNHPFADQDRFGVVFCNSSVDAVGHVEKSISQNNPFAMAFLDIHMDGNEDGVLVGQKLRSLDPYTELVFITGYSVYNPNEIAKRIPPVHKMIYVQKPFTVHQILHLSHALTSKWKNEKKDREVRERLHELVEEKTIELKLSNEKLEKKILERTQHLQDANTALKVLLNQREEDKKRIGETVLGNVEQLIKPLVENLKMTNLSARQENILTTLESNLEQIVSPFLNTLSTKYFKLTPAEMKIANFVRTGFSNKEIAELMAISKGTVVNHRHNLRKKLGVVNEKINLRTHLLSLEKP